MSISPIKIIAAILVWLLCVAAALGVYVGQWLYRGVVTFDANTTYTIEKGSSLHAVAKDLSDKGHIKWPKLWVYFARGVDLTDIKAGEYAMDAQISPVAILEKFNKGEVKHYSITFVEGSTFVDIIRQLHQNEKLTKRLDKNNIVAQLKKYGINVAHPEGWIFPDTYQFVAGDTDVDVLRRAYEKMKFVLSKEWISRDDNLPYKDAYEALIMASIVEKETGVAYERPEIAGVFVRRLQKGMRLQTDPTVIYGMGENYKGNIRRKDLKEPTPYNTYVIKGLPPTPIANPGQEAIYAALHPKQGESLFFVAKGDGTHYFSVTNEEHNRAVRKYQKKRKENYRSAPPTATPLATLPPSTTPVPSVGSTTALQESVEKEGAE
ncbi:MAG: endolytic transglycosylase MltG [Agarilytica sp.]